MVIFLKILVSLILGYIVGNIANIVISLLCKDVIKEENQSKANTNSTILSRMSNYILEKNRHTQRKTARITINNKRNIYLSKSDATILFFIMVTIACFFVFKFDVYFFKYLIFSYFLIITAEIDLDFQFICDEILISFAAISIVFMFIEWEFLDYVFGAAFGFVFYFIIYKIVYKIYDDEMFGFGDVLFNAVIGAFLGFKNTVISSILSFFVAILLYLISYIAQKIANKSKRDLDTDNNDDEDRITIPFGPAMSIAAFITTMLGNQILEKYLLLFT